MSVLKQLNNANGELILIAQVPDLDLSVLQRSFDFVPYDTYFNGSRYRTTSRIEIVADKFQLLPILPLYQPSYVNNIDGYGGIDRYYENIPLSLIESSAFRTMVNSWLKNIPFEVTTFSVHQIRTTDNGCPTPEGKHKDGTDWTGVFVVRRHNLKQHSGQTNYWLNSGENIISETFPEGTLLTHCDSYFVHSTNNIEKDREHEPSFRDVFVLTTPEHGINYSQQDLRLNNLNKENVEGI